MSCAAIATVAVAGQPPSAGAPGSDAIDDGFIEFLGSDDVGDAALWEALKKSAPVRAAPRGAAPQEPGSQEPASQDPVLREPVSRDPSA